MAWLPGILWAFYLAVARRRLSFAALTGGLVGISFLAGQLQFALGYVMALAVMAFGQTLYVWRRQGNLSGWPLLCFLISAGCGILIAGIQLLPFAEFLSLSRREITGGEILSLPVRQLITLIVPDFYGSPTADSFWSQINYNEGTIYAGLVVLYLAIAAVLSKPKFWVLYLSVVLAGLLYFVVGGPGVELIAWIPGLKYLSLHRSSFFLPLILGLLAAKAIDFQRLPWRSIIVPVLLICGILAGMVAANLEDILRYQKIVLPEIATALMFVLLTFLVLSYGHLYVGKRVYVRLSIVVLIFIDLVLFGRHYNPTGPIEDIFPPTPSIPFLQEHADSDRVVPLQWNNTLTFVPNILMLFGIREVGGYSSMVATRLYQLVVIDDPEIQWFWFNREHNMLPFSEPSDRLLDLFNVRYSISPEPMGEPSPVAEQVAAPCTYRTEPLHPGAPLLGSFQAQQSAINRIDLPFLIDGELTDESGTIEVRMWRLNDQTEVLMMEEFIMPKDVSIQPTQTVFFSPETEFLGQAYRWEIRVSDDFSGDLRLCADERGAAQIAVYGIPRSEVFEDDRVYINERYSRLPRAYVVYAAEPVEGDHDAVERILDAGFDYRNGAITATSVSLPHEPPRPATAATILSESQRKLRIQAEMQEPGLLVVSDLYYPGWMASVNGVPAPILRTNHVVRGVFLEPGHHIIDFKFQPRTLFWGALSSLLGITIIMAIWFFEWKLNQRTNIRKRPGKSGPESQSNIAI